MRPEEEEAIVDVIKNRLDVGYGLNHDRVADLIQESLNAVSKANPKRVLPNWDENRPSKSFVQNFVDRHGLVRRRTMGLSSARGAPTKKMVMQWFVDTATRFSKDPVFLEIFADKRRIFNQDESAFNCSAEKNKVLAPRGMREIPYQREPANPKENISVSVTINAAGNVADVLLLFKGTYNVAKEQLKDLPTDGYTGAWRTATNDSGYMTRDVFEDEVLPGNYFTSETDYILFLDAIATLELGIVKLRSRSSPGEL